MEPIYYLVFGLLLVFVYSIRVAATMIKSESTSPKSESETCNFEVRKLRFAAATFTGILVLLLIIGILSLVLNTPTALTIFEKLLTGLTPIAGVIVGYLFSSKEK